MGDGNGRTRYPAAVAPDTRHPPPSRVPVAAAGLNEETHSSALQHTGGGVVSVVSGHLNNQPPPPTYKGGGNGRRAGAAPDAHATPHLTGPGANVTLGRSHYGGSAKVNRRHPGQTN